MELNLVVRADISVNHRCDSTKNSFVARNFFYVSSAEAKNFSPLHKAYLFFAYDVIGIPRDVIIESRTKAKAPQQP